MLVRESCPPFRQRRLPVFVVQVLDVLKQALPCTHENIISTVSRHRGKKTKLLLVFAILGPSGVRTSTLTTESEELDESEREGVDVFGSTAATT